MNRYESQTLAQIISMKKTFTDTLDRNIAILRDPWNVKNCIQSHRIETDNQTLRTEIEKMEKTIKLKEKEISSLQETAKSLEEKYNDLFPGIEEVFETARSELKKNILELIPLFDEAREQLVQARFNLTQKTGGANYAIYNHWDGISRQMKEFNIPIGELMK